MPVTLSPPRTSGHVSVEEAIETRRSVREFTPEPLGDGEISQLLWAAYGLTGDQIERS